MSLLDKLSSYNIATSLIPGVVALEGLRATGIPLVSSKNLESWLVLAYLLGALSSRVGSLVAGPALRRFLAPKRNSYPEFIRASSVDPQIAILQETKNAYRTFIGAGISYFSILIGHALLDAVQINKNIQVMVAAMILTTLFCFSYIKQSRYLTNRIAISCQG